jgi:hypothetical protein
VSATCKREGDKRRVAFCLDGRTEGRKDGRTEGRKDGRTEACRGFLI